ncbi:hypothetical protein Syun_016555 [Stephania yunnanensis]|uniref:Uncharacterized protein n=1 Tax=Stephania yunnanensis TaxID=152371 RepID=A0AAP0J7K0_9MAGN
MGLMLDSTGFWVEKEPQGISSDENEGEEHEKEGDMNGDKGLGDDEVGDTDIEVCLVVKVRRGSEDIDASSSREFSEHGSVISKEETREDGDSVDDVNMAGN